jgi:hypothetical protein
MILVFLLGLLFAPAAEKTPEPPKQPIAFSHELHTGRLKLDCKTCHVNPSPGEMMTFPAESKCMACHQAIKTDSPEIQLLTKFVQDKKRVPWVRVYQVPTYVFWSHKSHLDAGATCQECHGAVATMPSMFRAVETNMGSCMTCHAKKRVSNDCQFCHEREN